MTTNENETFRHMADVDSSSENVDYGREFKILLNDNAALMDRLEAFKRACDDHEVQVKKRSKRRYYNLGLMARIEMGTTNEEIRSLLKNGARTFSIDSVKNKPTDFMILLERTKTAIADYAAECPNCHLTTGLALEINGDCCRIARMRNNCSVLVHCGDVITLTVNEAYRFSGFRQISHVINLKYYMKTLNLQDVIYIGKEVRGKVVKILRDSIAVYIEVAGLLNSYDYIELPDQCYCLNVQVFPDLFMNDLQLAADVKADFIIMPKIRCKPFLRCLKSTMINAFNFILIGAIDLEYIRTRMLDLIGIMKFLDFVFVPDMFTADSNIQEYILNEVIPMAKCFKKPIIGLVPLERCSDFKRFENHEFLWKSDTIFIEKSPWCAKYPLIVKKLLPLRDIQKTVFENRMAIKQSSNTYQSVVNFIIRTISSIECQAIIIHSNCEPAAVAFARVEIYCPVLIMFPIDEQNKEEVKEKTRLAKALNLRRNLRATLYTKEMNKNDLKPIEYGLHYGRCCCLLETGDFVITIEVCKEDKEHVTYAMDDDVVILRAFYVPPLPIAEPFKYCC